MADQHRAVAYSEALRELRRRHEAEFDQIYADIYGRERYFRRSEQQRRKAGRIARDTLEMINDAPHGLTVGEASKGTGHPNSSTRNCLQTAEEEGWLTSFVDDALTRPARVFQITDKGREQLT